MHLIRVRMKWPREFSKLDVIYSCNPLDIAYVIWKDWKQLCGYLFLMHHIIFTFDRKGLNLRTHITSAAVCRRVKVKHQISLKTLIYCTATDGIPKEDNAKLICSLGQNTSWQTMSRIQFPTSEHILYLTIQASLILISPLHPFPPPVSFLFFPHLLSWGKRLL